MFRLVRHLCLAGAPLLALCAAPAQAAGLAERACATLAARVDAIPGDGAVLLRSWDGAVGSGPRAEPALAGAAFTYDNALAVIALTACGRRGQATRVGAALLAAATADRLGPAGRLRNAYRAGSQAERPIPPNGWWDGAAGRWAEDPTQVGTATGNVAWAGLALLTLAEATGDGRWRDGARLLARWAVEHTADPRGPGGYSGGLIGYDDAPRSVGWKSTEHNADLAALFGWLARGEPMGGEPQWAAPEAAARGFLAAMWDRPSGRFLIGTGIDGFTPNANGSGLDAQVWPLLLPGAPAAWRRSLAWVERWYAVPGGFDFNDDRDGLWVEGTAQAALAYRVVGRPAEAERLLAGLADQVSPGGYLWATREPRVTTGLALRPDSTSADFFYERRPALAATAWVVLAALDWNPYTGVRGGVAP
jgi:hypothetical protein